MFLQSHELVQRFEVSPDTIYGWALAAGVVLVISFSVVIVYLFRFFNQKLEEKEKLSSDERNTAQLRYDALESKLMAAKLDAVAALRDVLNALNMLAVGQKEGTQDILNRIEILIHKFEHESQR